MVLGSFSSTPSPHPRHRLLTPCCGQFLLNTVSSHCPNALRQFLLNTVFVCLALASGIPILLLVPPPRPRSAALATSTYIRLGLPPLIRPEM